MATLTANYDTSDLDPYINELAGQVYPPDTQCEYTEGTGSYLLRVGVLLGYITDKICIHV